VYDCIVMQLLADVAVDLEGFIESDVDIEKLDVDDLEERLAGEMIPVISLFSSQLTIYYLYPNNKSTYYVTFFLDLTFF
jgi:hypothetical protein